MIGQIRVIYAGQVGPAGSTGAGGGGTYTISNLGSGEEVYSSQSGTTFYLRTLSGTSGVTLTSGPQTITFSVDESSITINNLSGTLSGSKVDIHGTTEETGIADNDEVLIYDADAGANRRMTKVNFVAGISGAGESNTASNLGTGEGVYHSKSGIDLRFRSLTGTSPIVITSGANIITYSLNEAAVDITALSGTLGTDQFSAYDDLVAESKIGVASDQVASGSHVHSQYMLLSTYDPSGDGSVEEAENSVLDVRKASVGTISPGQAVYAVSYNVAGWVEVEVADADDPSKMPAIGVANENITNSANAHLVLLGTVTNLNTNSWPVGTPLYVSTVGDGTLTSTKPTGTSLIQKMATVTRQNVAVGSILVQGAGRSNDVPNITTDYLWMGNASSVATATSLDSTLQHSGTTLKVVDNTSTQKVQVAYTGALVGTRQQVNFITGSNVTISVADNAGSDRVDVTIASSGGGTGEVNTASNLGDGEGVFSNKNGVDLRFRSLKATSPVTIASGTTDITYGLNEAAVDITALSGTLTTDQFSAYDDLVAEGKIGVGADQVASGSHVHSIYLQSSDLTGSSTVNVAGDPITFSVTEVNVNIDNLSGTLAGSKVNIHGTTAEASIEDTDEILVYDATATANRRVTRANFLAGLSGSGEANTATNLGDGEGVFASKAGVALQFRSLKATSPITITSGTNDITYALNEAAVDITALSGTLTTDQFSAYDDLVAESKIGVGSDQVASGSHLHGGVYSPVTHYHDASEIISGTLSTDRFSAYSDLTAEAKIGVSADQVASGSHLHGGVYSPVTHYHDASEIISGTLSTDRFSAYSDLTAEAKIGVGADQVASGSHIHATYLESSDLTGSSTINITGSPLTFSVIQPGISISNITGNLSGSRVDINGTTEESSIATDDYILVYDTSEGVNRKFTRDNLVAGLSGSGEANLGANLGTGTGVFKQKSGVTLQFLTLVPNSNKLTIVSGTNEVILDAVEANFTLDNIGGTLGVTKGGTGLSSIAASSLLWTTSENTLAAITTGAGLQVSGTTLLVADNSTTQKVQVAYTGALVGTRQEINFITGTNVTLAVADDVGNDRVNVTISATGGAGEANTASNEGSGTGLYKTKTDVNLEFYTLYPASNKVSIAQSGDEVLLDAVEANFTLDNIGGTLGVAKGGTGLSSITQSRLLWSSAGDTLSEISTGAGLQVSGTTLKVVDNSTTQKVQASYLGAVQGTRQELNFITGSNVTISVADNAGEDRVDITIGASGGAGEANTASNQGSGTGLYKTKTDVDLEFYSLYPASNKISISQSGDEVLLDAAEANFTLDNIGGTLGVTKGGTGLSSIAQDKLLYTSAADTLAELTLSTGLSFSGANLQVDNNSTTQKTIVSLTGTTVGTRQEINFISGTNVTLAIADNAGSDSVDVTINATGGSGEVNTASNQGTGTGLYKTKTDVDLEFYSLEPNSNKITIAQSGNEVIFDAAEANFTLDNIGGTLGVTKGGTGLSSIAASKLLYTSASNTLAELTLSTGLSFNGANLQVDNNTTTQKTIVSLTGSVIGTRQEVNFISGTNVTLTVADNSGEDRVDVTINSTGGSGTPPSKVIHWMVASLQSVEANAAPVELLNGTNVDYLVCAFDDTTVEYRNGSFNVPGDIDTGGTVTFRAFVAPKTGAATTNVQLRFDHLARGDNEAYDTAYTSEDSGDKAITATTGNLTKIEWTETVSNLAWAAEELILFRIARIDATANDLTGDMYWFSFEVEIPRT